MLHRQTGEGCDVRVCLSRWNGELLVSLGALGDASPAPHPPTYTQTGSPEIRHSVGVNHLFVHSNLHALPPLLLSSTLCRAKSLPARRLLIGHASQIRMPSLADVTAFWICERGWNTPYSSKAWYPSLQVSFKGVPKFCRNFVPQYAPLRDHTRHEGNWSYQDFPMRICSYCAIQQLRKRPMNVCGV